MFRFENLLLDEGNLIMYVGGNKDGADGGKLMGLCPKWWDLILTIEIKINSLYS